MKPVVGTERSAGKPGCIADIPFDVIRHSGAEQLCRGHEADLRSPTERRRAGDDGSREACGSVRADLFEKLQAFLARLGLGREIRVAGLQNLVVKSYRLLRIPIDAMKLGLGHGFQSRFLQ